MKIDFILSDTTKNATSLALKNIVNSAESDLMKNHIVIVPETKSIIIEKELLNLSKNGAFTNVFIYSFVRLLDRLEAVSKDKIVSKQTLIVLIRKIISENIDKLICYKKTAKTVGFAEKIYDTIAQFKSSGITTADLRNSLQTKSESLKAKLTDILFLYEEYENYLAGSLYDDCDKLALISNFSKESEFIKESNIYIIGFDNITYEMQTVLRDLAINSKSITFSCVYFNQKRLNKHIQTNELFLKYKYIADSLKYPYKPKFIESKMKGDFRYIKNHLFSVEKRKFRSNGNISVFNAKTEKIEIDYVANTILNEVARGLRFKDIGVLVNGIENKIDMIEDCFKVYKIPYFINVARNIDNHFLIKFIINAFELYTNNLRFENVLTFVSNPLFGVENYDIFERYVEEIGVNYNDFLQPINPLFIENYLEIKNLKFENKNTLDLLNEIELKLKVNDEETIENSVIKIKISEINQLFNMLERLKNFYEQLRMRLKNSRVASDYLSVIDYISDFFSLQSSLEKCSIIQKEANLEIDSEITKAVYGKFELFSSQIYNFLGKTDMDISEFLLIYKSGFSSYKINLSPVSIDCVIIQDNTDGFYNIKDMFIVGATEGQFPSKIQDSGIIIDSELEEAKTYIGKTIEPAVKDINRREKYKAYEYLLEPSEKLFISYSEKRQDGKSNNPSQIVTSIQDMFYEKIQISNYSVQEFVNYDVFESRFSNKINEFLNHKNSIEEVNKFRNILGDKISKELNEALSNISYGVKDFTLNNISELYFDNDKTSISQLQTYFDCPYKFFVNYGLKLKENKIATISSIDVGTIIHRVAEIFIKNLKDYLDISDANLDEKIIEIVNFAMEENGFTIQNNRSLFNLILQECNRLCKYIILEQSYSSFKFDMAEYSFDGENAIKLDTKGNRKISIHGKIDRIDKFKDYVRVIDYKTGKISSSLKSIYYGDKIQLAIYLSAIQEAKNLNTAGIFYFPIHSEYNKSEKDSKNTYKMKGFILDDIDVIKYMDSTLSSENLSSNFVPILIKTDKETGEISFNNKTKRYSKEEFNDIKRYVNKLCAMAVDEILDGYIEPSPIADTNSDIPKSCAYCKLAGFCNLEKAKFIHGRNNNGKVEAFCFKEKEDNVDGN